MFFYIFGTENHGFFKDTAWLRITFIFYTALRDYGLLLASSRLSLSQRQRAVSIL